MASGLLALLAKSPKTPGAAPMGGAGEPDADDGDMKGDARAMAGEALIAAIKRGDGAGVADAIDQLSAHAEPDADEEPATEGE